MNEILPQIEKLQLEHDQLQLQLQNKELEFKKQKAELKEVYRNLKKQFKVYDEEKTKSICKWVKEAREQLNKDSLFKYSHMRKDVLYVQGLESKKEEYQLESFKKLKEIEELEKKLDKCEKEKLENKLSMLTLRSQLRKLPYETQMDIVKKIGNAKRSKYETAGKSPSK